MNLQGETILQGTEEASVKGVKMLASPPLPHPLRAVRWSGQTEVVLVHLCGPRTQMALGVQQVEN